MNIKQKQIAICFTILIFGSSLLAGNLEVTNNPGKIFLDSFTQPIEKLELSPGFMILHLLPSIESELPKGIYEINNEKVRLDRVA